MMQKKFPVILFSICCLAANGQTMREIEQDLVEKHKRINYWVEYDGTDDKIDKYDSLDKANEIFLQALLKYTGQYPATLQYKFSELDSTGVTIVTSEDGLFRIYSWDSWTGGTMHFYEHVRQYKAGDKLIVETTKKEEGYPGHWYYPIYTLSNGNKKYYLVINHGTYSTTDSYQGIKVFSIGKSRLNEEEKIIKTEEGLSNEVGIAFNFHFFYQREERPIKLIEYDTKTKTILLPVMSEEGNITGQSIKYRFTGKYFETVK